MAGLNKQQQVRLKSALINGVTDIKDQCAIIGASKESEDAVATYVAQFKKDPVVIARSKASKTAEDRAAERVKVIEKFDAETVKLVREAGIIKEAQKAK